MPEETENQRVFKQTDIKFSLMDMLATAQKSKFILRGIISCLHDMKQAVYLQSYCYKKRYITPSAMNKPRKREKEQIKYRRQRTHQFTRAIREEDRINSNPTSSTVHGNPSGWREKSKPNQQPP